MPWILLLPLLLLGGGARIALPSLDDWSNFISVSNWTYNLGAGARDFVWGILVGLAHLM